MAAWCMAVYFRGLSGRETHSLTDAMIRSGETLDLGSALGRKVVDKHSTGGVGDKITLPLVPVVVACGAAVPQLSGRGLGHTGGTLDKLESIPGWRASLSNDEMMAVLRDVGGVICGAGAELAPADKKLYALRDVTGTVESIPLIASSIMSKKIAEGADGLILDVKTGSGAFTTDPAQSRVLAETMVRIGNDAGVTTRALITAMDVPLGLAVGNALEVTESVEVLAGGGPADVVEVTVLFAREMLDLAGIRDVDPAETLRDGSAMDVWRRMVRAQGGDPDAPLPKAREHEVVYAPTDGVVTRMDAMGIGVASWRLGAGRARQEDPVSAGAGVLLHAKPGDLISAGAPLLTLFTDEPDRFPGAHEALVRAVEVRPEGTPVYRLPLVIDRLT